MIDFENFDCHSFVANNFAIDNFVFNENRLNYYFVAKIAIAIENLTSFDFVTIFAQWRRIVATIEKKNIDFRMIDRDQLMFDKRVYFDNRFDKNVIVVVVVVKNKHDFDKYKK